MAILLSPNELTFPPVELAHKDGLLAYGGDLSTERLLLAYRSGIFPWYSRYSPILWWSPDPRFVIDPANFHYSKSLRPLLNQNKFEISFNQNFEAVLKNCKQIYRKGQPGTWITPELERAVLALHKIGFAHSVEVWQEGKLVGGLYGEILGKVFFGESMFAHVPNASKVGFVVLMKKLIEEHNFQLIDCQVYTDHLARFGADMMPRQRFLDILSQQVGTDNRHLFDT